ncbi:MAG: efflux RND transporter periplasmic adaptor subunit [Planctomycetaceae bacterium]
MADSSDTVPVEQAPWWRWLLTPLLATAAVVLGFVMFVSLASLKEPPPQVQPSTRVFRVPVFQVEQSTVRPLVSTFGTARPDQEVLVAAEVAGRVVDSSQLDVGVAVRGLGVATDTRLGPLVEIDPQTYEQRLLQAEALLAQDTADLAKLDQDVQNTRRLWQQKQQSLSSAKAQWDLQKRLIEQGAGREAEVRRTELEYQQVEAAAIQLQSELDLEQVRRQQLVARQKAHQQDIELAKLDVGRAKVFAPFSGVISEVHVEDGQYVRPGEPLFKLTAVDRVQIPLPLPVSDSAAISARIQAGEQPRVQLAEHEAAECRWVGRVTRIAPVADELTRTVQVFAEVENMAGRDPLRPGTFVHASIESLVLPSVMLVPRGAIFEGGVFVVRQTSDLGDKSSSTTVAERRTVQIRQTLQSFAVIESGLQPGDQVVLTNLDVLSDGTPLTIVEQRTVAEGLSRETVPGFEIVEPEELSGRLSTPAAEL